MPRALRLLSTHKMILRDTCTRDMRGLYDSQCNEPTAGQRPVQNVHHITLLPKSLWPWLFLYPVGCLPVFRSQSVTIRHQRCFRGSCEEPGMPRGAPARPTKHLPSYWTGIETAIPGQHSPRVLRWNPTIRSPRLRSRRPLALCHQSRVSGHFLRTTLTPSNSCHSNSSGNYI